MHANISTLLGHYGYALLFLLVALESLGIPLPGETALITAAALAGLGHFSLAAVIATAAVAAIAGDTGGYWIGRTGGLALLRRHGRLLRIDEKHLEHVRGFFERHGAKTIFIGRFIALLRTWAAFFAGVARMPYGVFLLYNASGGIVWAALFGVLGYVFGRNLPALQRYVGRASIIAIAVIVVVVAGVLLWRRLRRRGAGPDAESAPGARGTRGTRGRTK